MFRIDNLDVLSALGLDARPGSYRYSLKEVTQDLAELDRQLNLAGKVPANERSLFHNKLGELSAKLGQYRIMEGAFKSPGVLGRTEEVTDEYAQRVAEFAVQMRRAGAPLPVPPERGRCAVDDGG